MEMRRIREITPRKLISLLRRRKSLRVKCSSALESY